MKPEMKAIPNEVRKAIKPRETEMEIRGAENMKGLELRALEEGTFEGYIAVWNTVDSYKSTFKRGAFSKTIQERGDRIKVLYDHDAVIGKVVEIREDDKGVFVRGRLTMDLERSRDTHALMMDGVIDTLSFGFSVVDQTYESGVRSINEVKLFEVSPVAFEANENAVVTGVRSAGGEDNDPVITNEPEEKRGDILDAVQYTEMHRRRRLLIEMLDEQLTDEFYFTSTFELFAENSEKLIDEFKDLYMAWAADFAAHYTETEARSLAGGNALSCAMRQHYIANKTTPEGVAVNTSLSLSELRSLTAGKPIAGIHKLADLPAEIRDAHQQVKREAVEALCAEIRAGLSAAEKERITSLLNMGEADSGVEVRSSIGFLQNLQTEFSK